MNWWREYADRIQPDAPLGRLTWFKLGGPARYLFHPNDAADLARLAARARDEQLGLRVLGAGANVLIKDDGFDGVVVRLDDGGFRRVDRHGNTVTVGAGVDLMPLCKEIGELGLSGLEGLAGIPASVGGAVRMNAGGRFGEIGDVVTKVTVLNRSGEVETWSRDRIGFRYRGSALGDVIVLDATLELREGDREVVQRRFQECFDFKTRTQPLRERSAGCIFKNPTGQSAGALIDRAGLKGATQGAVRVSERHANFMVAERGATSSDVLRLIDRVRDGVRQAFATELELEIEVW